MTGSAKKKTFEEGTIDPLRIRMNRRPVKDSGQTDKSGPYFVCGVNNRQFPQEFAQKTAQIDTFPK